MADGFVRDGFLFRLSFSHSRAMANEVTFPQDSCDSYDGGGVVSLGITSVNR